MKAVVQSFQKTVTASGTAERLSATVLRTSMVIIQALQSNTNNVAVGDSAVAKTTGIELDALDSITISAPVINGFLVPVDLKEIWLDVDTNGEGVNALYVEVS